MPEDRDEQGRFLENNKQGARFVAGNTDAQKWTEETVLPKVRAIYATLEEGTEEAQGNIIRANDIKLAGEVRIMHGVTKQQWSEWKEKFRNNPVVFDLMEIISEILECRLIYSGGRMDEIVLKNKYGYSDKTEITGAEGAPLHPKTDIDYSKLSTEVLHALINASESSS